MVVFLRGGVDTPIHNMIDPGVQLDTTILNIKNVPARYLICNVVGNT